MIEEGRIMKIKQYIFKVEGTVECPSRAGAVDKIENAIIEITNIDVVEDIAN